MKKLIIATSILFAFSATFAQVGKPSKKTPMSSKAPTSVSSLKETKPNKNTNVKPVGKTYTKPAPVVSKVSPSKGTNPVGPSSNRSSRSAVGTVSEKNAANVQSIEEVKGNSTTSKSRSSRSAVGTVSEKNAANVQSIEEVKGNSTTSKSRSSRSAVGTVSEKNAANVQSVEEVKGNSTTSKSRSSESAVGTVNEIELKKPDADYCKGWKEGYIKAFSKATGKKISSSDVPSCVVQGNCEGYKCGYAAGIRNAERRIK